MESESHGAAHREIPFHVLGQHGFTSGHGCAICRRATTSILGKIIVDVRQLAHFRDGIVHASPEFISHFIQLRLEPLTNRLPQHREVTVAPPLPKVLLLTSTKSQERIDPCEGIEVGISFHVPIPTFPVNHAEHSSFQPAMPKRCWAHGPITICLRLRRGVAILQPEMQVRKKSDRP